MRKVLLFVALLAVAISATPASAVVSDASDLTAGSYIAKYSNFSDFYYAAGTSAQGTTAGANGLPLYFSTSPAAAIGALESAVAAYQTGGANSVGTLENRTIFNSTSIQTTGGKTVWNGSSQQLSGLLYNLTLSGVTVSTSGSDTILTLDYVADTRSSPLSGAGLATAPAGSGGVLQIYASNSTTWGSTSTAPDPNNVGSLTPSGQSASSVDSGSIVHNGTGTWGPSSWVAGTGSTSDSYVGVDGSLWLSAEFVAFGDIGITAADGDSSTVYQETLDLNTGVGSSEGYLHAVGGSEYSELGLGDMGFGPDVDLLLISDESQPGLNASGDLEPSANYYGTGYWPSDSQDPVRFDLTVIPEPATLSLLGFGIAGLLARCRKK